MEDDALKNNMTWYIYRLVTIDTDLAVMSFDNIKQVNHLKCPLLVVTGEKIGKYTPYSTEENSGFSKQDSVYFFP